MKIGQKLILGFLAVAFLVGIVGYVTINKEQKIKNSYEEVISDTIPKIIALQNIRFFSLRMITEVVSYVAKVAEKELAEEEEEEFLEAKEEVEKWEAEYEKSIAPDNDMELQFVRDVDITEERIEDLGVEIIALKKKGVSGKEILEKTEELEEAEEEFIELIDSIILHEKEELVEASELVNQNFTNSKNTVLGGTSVAILFAVVLGLFLARAISNPIAKLNNAATKIGEGKLDTSVDIKSKDELGSLAESFNRMRISLQTKEKDILKIKTAITELNDQMRGDLELADLGNNILSYLVPHLDAQIGALYLMETGNLLKLISSYACVEQNNLPSEFKLGESLVGQVAMDKGAIIISKVPEGYFDISTGLGGIVPRNILILPLQYEGMVKGVIELGSVNEFSDKEVNFLNQVVENIAISVHTAQSRKQMQELLEESQGQAEELQSREEEMLANNE